jgi:hypothetical protein
LPGSPALSCTTARASLAPARPDVAAIFLPVIDNSFLPAQTVEYYVDSSCKENGRAALLINRSLEKIRYDGNALTLFRCPGEKRHSHDWVQHPVTIAALVAADKHTGGVHRISSS